MSQWQTYRLTYAEAPDGWHILEFRENGIADPEYGLKALKVRLIGHKYRKLIGRPTWRTTYDRPSEVCQKCARRAGLI